MAVTPDGAFAYVTNFASNNVSVIDTASNAVTATVTVGSAPLGVAITPDGAFAYVVESAFSGTVSVIETASNAVTTTVAVGSHPADVAITPDGAFAYVTNFLSNDVSVIDIASNAVTAGVAVGIGAQCLAITPEPPGIEVRIDIKPGTDPAFARQHCRRHPLHRGFRCDPGGPGYGDFRTGCGYGESWTHSRRGRRPGRRHGCPASLQDPTNGHRMR